MFNGGDSGGLEELISRSIQTNKDIIIDHVNHSLDYDDDQNSFNVNDDIAINDIVTTPFNINPNIDLLSPDNNVVFLDANKCIYTTPLETTTDQPGGGFVLMPKLEHINNYYGCNSNIDFINHMNLIGLNLLGHHDHDHMCFSILGDEENINVVNDHLFGGGWSKMEAGVMNMTPTCQIEGCNADLTLAKHYHRRHKVCEFHSKASIVLAAGVTQRYCQQCSRFHILSEFDEGKRSCRKRLADHNRRRRKLSHNESTNLINDQP